MRRRIVLFAVFSFLALPLLTFADPERAVPLSSPDGAVVAIPLKDLGAGASFYSFRTKSNAVVRFFALLDASRGVHVAFDACDVCYQAKKGFRVADGQTICNNCGRRYPLAAIGRDNQAGGCWPSYLPIRVSNGAVSIRVADLERKQFLFP